MNFKDYYNDEIKKQLMEKLELSNPMSAPRIMKIVLNVGVGEALTSRTVMEKVEEQIATIAGQKPVVTKAKKSVSAFKVRKGFPIGVKVTLRGAKMYAFLEKMIKIVIPRLRDLRGISQTTVDQSGNLNIGFTEQTVFPEIDFDKIDKIRGLEVTVVTNARSQEKGRVLFETLGVPFKKS